MTKQPSNSKEYRRQLLEKQKLKFAAWKQGIEQLDAMYGRTLDPSLEARARKLLLHVKKGGNVIEPYTVLPCKVKVKGEKEWRNPCLVRFDLDSMWPGRYPLSRIIVGGQIENIAPSEYALPAAVALYSIKETFEYRMGSWMPIEVRIPDNPIGYLIPAFSHFFRTASHVGMHVDHKSPQIAKRQQRFRYEWADNMEEHMTIALCNSLHKQGMIGIIKKTVLSLLHSH